MKNICSSSTNLHKGVLVSKKTKHSGNVILDKLMKEHTIILGGEINHQSVEEVMQRLIRLQMQSGDRKINLIINSNGGCTNSALYLCDFMTSMITATVRGIVLGVCGSAATFPLLCCDERVGTPYSRFLIHSGTRGNIRIPINETTTEHLEQLLRETQSSQEKTKRFYMRLLTPPEWDDSTTDEERREFVKNIIARGDQQFDDWMSAEEAVKIGLIQHVTFDNLDIFFNSN